MTAFFTRAPAPGCFENLRLVTAQLDEAGVGAGEFTQAAMAENSTGRRERAQTLAAGSHGARPTSVERRQGENVQTRPSLGYTGSARWQHF